MKIDTAEKKLYNHEEYLKKWGTTKNIIVHLRELGDFHKLTVHGITTSNGEKIMAGVASMFESGYFMGEMLIKCEEMAEVEADNTWEYDNSFSTKLWQTSQQFSKATRLHTQFHKRVTSAQEKSVSTTEYNRIALVFLAMQ